MKEVDDCLVSHTHYNVTLSTYSPRNTWDITKDCLVQLLVLVVVVVVWVVLGRMTSALCTGMAEMEYR